MHIQSPHILTGRTQAYISKFEHGQLRLDVADLLVFAKCLKMNPHLTIDELDKETTYRI